MVGKIEYRNNVPHSIETEQTQNADPTGSSSVQPQRETLNFGLAKITDGFEHQKLSNSFDRQLNQTSVTGDEAYSVTELRNLIQAAKAENKPPFTEANLNKLLLENRGNYKDIAADLKEWISKNMYLTPRQKAPLDRLSEEDLKMVQDSAQTAIELNKPMSVQITNYPGSQEKILKLKETEIGETVKLQLGKVPVNIADQEQQVAAENAALE
jgi:hypothetical protein